MTGMQSADSRLRKRKDIRLLALALLILPWVYSPLFAQSARSLIDGGNEAYDSEDFPEAEINYRKALEKNDELPKGHFNLGDALYKQGKYDVSTEAFEKALEDTSGSEIKANSLFNKGNSLFKQQKYDESIDAYVNSLKLAPDDLDAKYNLLYAIKKLEEQESSEEEQESQSEQGEDGQEDKEQDKQSEKQDGEKSDERGEEQTPDNQEEKESEQRQEEEQTASEEEREMSRAEAERILQALKESEMDVQKKLRKKPEGRASVEKDW